MIVIPAEVEVDCSAERIFDLIMDFRGQDRWLTASSAFHGTTDISSNPATLGTTYREPGPFGVRYGTITELARPTAVTFHQPMTMKLHLGTIDVLLRYTLTPTHAPAPATLGGGASAPSTHVKRVVTLGIPWSLKLVQPLLVRAFRVESGRTLLALKAYADTLPLNSE